MPYPTTRSERSDSQTSLIRSPQSSAYATAGHSESVSEYPIMVPSASDPAILVVPASPIDSATTSGDSPGEYTRHRPPSVASSISSTSTIAATEEVKHRSVDYVNPLGLDTPSQTSNSVRDPESGAEHPSRHRLVFISAISVMVIAAIVLVVVLVLHPGHPGQYHVYPDKHTERPDNARI
ncbi:hypothetical protein AURDEDRAFT_163633 [Auricularia subglabra TFB-10046 SS5]|nr:hypothetical protein AURDEDRAFT_163633 [Auricularia subglabra TFB-10046 SS5]